MRFTIYALSDDAPWIRPADLERHWMDATPERFAYRCLPLKMANQHGWEILCATDFVARWNGGPDVNDIEIKATGGHAHGPQSHFGSGVLTFHVNALIRTDPGYNLWVTGSVNAAKDAIQPLSGVIEADWSPYTFTMNWRFTRPDETITFTMGEPFCHFFPIPRALPESVEMVAAQIADDPVLEARYRNWAASREAFNRDLATPGSVARHEKWQRGYFRGQNPDGTPGSPDHQTKLDLCPFPGRR